MTRRPSRSIALVIAGLALSGSVFAIERALETLGIAVAFKAKMMCSGVFVADRPPATVQAELEIDDLEPLRFIRTHVDPSEGVVTATVLGFVKRTAASRGATGCAIVPRGKRRTELPRAGPDSLPIWKRDSAQSFALAPADDPIRVGLDSIIARAFGEPDTTRLRRTQAVIVLQNGRIVGERYAPGITAGTRLLGWSMTKSVMNALIGILVRDGKLSLDDPAPIPHWQRPGDPRQAITVRQLLHMSSGLRLNEVMASLRSDVIRMLLTTEDMAAFAASRDLAAAPGTHWSYASGTSVILARVIRHVLNDDAAYWHFPRQALFARLGMHSALIETDATGTFVGSSLMYATARDWARFGQLYLNDGVWNGERILPEGWVQFTSTPAPADPNRSYGAHFWLGVPSEPGDAVGTLTEGALQAAGHEGQFITILPSHNAVIVRLGRTRYGDAWDQAAFVREVVAKLNALPALVVKQSR